MRDRVVNYKQKSLGVDDMNVVSTAKGWMLRIKQGAQQLNAMLYGNEALDKDVFIPKAWHKKGVMPSTDGDDEVISLPNYINKENILGVSFGIGLGNGLYTYMGLGGKAHNGSSPADEYIDGRDDVGSAEGNPSSPVYAMYVHYHHTDKFAYIANTIRIETFPHSTSIDDANYRLTVFFK